MDEYDGAILKPNNLLVFPNFYQPNDVSRVYPGGLTTFDRDRFVSNMEYIDDVVRLKTGIKDTDRLPESSRYDFYPLLEAQPSATARRADFLEFCSTPQEILIGRQPAVIEDPNYYSFNIHQSFVNLPDGPHTILQTTHGGSPIVIEEATQMAGLQPEQVAVLILDSHVDAVVPPAEPELRDAPGYYSKTRVINRYLGMRMGGVVLVGLDREDQYLLSQGTLQGIPYAEALAQVSGERNSLGLLGTMIASHVQQKGRVHDEVVVPSDGKIVIPVGYCADDGHFMDKRKLSRNTIEALRKLKDDTGITVLVTDLDLDVAALWAEGITATPYNPMATVVAMGNQNVTAAIPLGGLHQYEIRELKRNPDKRRYEMGKIREAYTKLSNAATSVLFPHEESRHLARQVILGTNPGGLYLRDFSSLWINLKNACKELGIQFGIPLSRRDSGPRLSLVISEVDGPDEDEKTTKAIRQIAKLVANE